MSVICIYNVITMQKQIKLQCKTLIAAYSEAKKLLDNTVIKTCSIMINFGISFFDRVQH